MSYCQACGAQVDEGAAFCTACGAEQSIAAAAAPSAAAPVAATANGAAQPRSSGNQLINMVVVDNGGEIFDDIKGFNWGAALLGFVWAFGHRQWKLGLIGIVLALIVGGIPIVNFIVLIAYAALLGGAGYTLAAMGAGPGKYSSFADLKAAEKSWAFAGWILLLVGLAMAIVAVFISMFLAGLSFFNNF